MCKKLKEASLRAKTKTPTTGFFPIAGAKVSRKNRPSNLLWGEWGEVFRMWGEVLRMWGDTGSFLKKVGRKPLVFSKR
jgi:hypothetical protein